MNDIDRFGVPPEDTGYYGGEGEEDIFSVTELGLDYAPDYSLEDTAGRRGTYSAGEALIECVNTCGRVDIGLMEEMSGIRAGELISELEGSAIFQDPAVFEGREEWDPYTGWLLRAQYCRGNILKKVEDAEKARERFPGHFAPNAEELRKLLPSTLVLESVHVSLGATWVPAEMYSEFIRELLHMSTYAYVSYNRELAVWKIDPPMEAKDSVYNNFTYGTADLSAIKIIEQTMNAKTVRVYDYSYSYRADSERRVDRSATLAAQEKQRAIIDEFSKWVYKDVIRKRQLEELYNDAFVGYASSAYDGSFLTFPGMNPEVTLYPHQRNAIARILLSGQNVLLSHDVGTGKTYEIIASVHELKRMGLSGKNLVVVPNPVLKATVDAHRYLYPEDDILVIYPRNFTPKDRARVLERVRDEDHVAVYMAYSSFDMIVMSKDYWIDKWQRELRALRKAIANAECAAEQGQLKREEKVLSRKLANYAVEARDTPWPTFDDLGIDTLVVDEAHNYKNIPLYSRTENIVGMHGSGSRKCVEMLEKAHSVRHLVMATGTPLTNSLADLFVMQTYLQPQELRFREIDSFDMWINCFGERETNFEIDVDTNGLREMTRFSTFHNLTELMGLFSSVCDFHHSATGDSELPRFRGYTDVRVPRSRAQTDYIRDLAKRTEKIRAGIVGRTEDNLLKITTDGRKCALDVRLVGLESEGVYSSKVGVCSREIMDLYHRYPGCCQIVFCDIGTPKSAFNVYNSLKDRLVSAGVREQEIAFVHDAVSEAARAKLFLAMNRGMLRVVIGSTAKLGIGVNVQERLIAVHHLSVPWRPADMVQREGRIIRPGNTCPEVFIYRYITEGSFDAYSWQLLENKQRFISSFLSGTYSGREMEDIADAVLSYAEVKALAIGNPLIKNRVETANLLERAKIASRQRQKQLISLRTVLENAPWRMQKVEDSIAAVQADMAFYARSRGRVRLSEREAFGEELIEALRDNVMEARERVFDEYQGFTIVLPAGMAADRPHVLVRRQGGGSYYLEMDTERPLGCAKKIDALLEGFGDRLEALGRQRALIENQVVDAKADIERGNPFEERIDILTAQLAEIDKKLSEGSREAS